MAERANTNSTEWTLTQLSGRPWGDIANWGRDDANANNMVNAGTRRLEVFAGNLDAKSSINLAGLPVQLLAGKVRLTTFDITWGAQNWTFVGPRGSQTDPTTMLIDESRHPTIPSAAAILRS